MHDTRPDTIPDIAELLPHRPPMRLLERVLCWSREALEAQVTIAAGSAFLTPDGVPAWVGLEYLGQAAAAYFSLVAAPGTGAMPGLLVGCSRYQCEVPVFVLGSVLTIRVRPASAPGAALVRFRGEIEGTAAAVASGELSVYLPRGAR